MFDICVKMMLDKTFWLRRYSRLITLNLFQMGWNIQAPENKGHETLQHREIFNNPLQKFLKLSNPNFENQNTLNRLDNHWCTDTLKIPISSRHL